QRFQFGQVFPTDVQRRAAEDLAVLDDHVEVADILIELAQTAVQHRALIGESVDEPLHRRHVGRARLPQLRRHRRPRPWRRFRYHVPLLLPTFTLSSRTSPLYAKRAIFATPPPPSSPAFRPMRRMKRPERRMKRGQTSG